MDVFIFNTQDGGDINPVNGSPEMRDGLESYVYLSLFGGNVADDGRKNSPLTWWGNLVEPTKYVSETQNLLATLEPSPRNLRRIEDAARRDLSALDYDIAVTASMPGINRVALNVIIDGVPVFEQATEWGEPIGRPPVPSVLVNDGYTLSGSSIIAESVTLAREDGSLVAAQVGAGGVWSFDPYPLNYQEVAEVFAVGIGGALSARVSVVGVAVLRYDGTVDYDGSQKFNGIKI